ncbi:killer cell lectin-like receptor subfamily B member 1 [Lissotriton helveticus]
MEDEEGYTTLQLKGQRKPEDEEGYTALQLKGRRKPEDEEGYTALQLKGQRKPEDEEGYTALQVKGQWKPEDEEGYTALQFKGRRKTKDGCEDVQRADPQAPLFQRPALWIIVLLTVLLVLAVVGSGVWIFKLHQEIGDLKMLLKQRDKCKYPNKHAGTHPTPSCPLKWHQHGEKCYYFSEKTYKKSWNESHEDCSSRSSHLVVIEEKAELDYLSAKQTNQAWIGLLSVPVGGHWTWIGGPTLNETVFPVTGPADGGRCGAMNSGSIESSRCITSLSWICQKEPVSCSSRV